MVAQNGKISGRQLNRMLVLDLFAASSMVLPRLLPRICGRQGVYALSAAALFVLLVSAVYIKAGLGCGGDLCGSVRCRGGEIFGSMILLFFILKFLLSAVFILRMFSEVISRTFLTEMPKRLIAALMILTALYGVTKGRQTRGRLCEILVWFVLVPMMAVVFLAAPQMRVSRLLPMEIMNGREILSGSFLCVSVFSVCEFLLFSVPYVRTEGGREPSFSLVYRAAVKAILAAFFCMAVLYFVCIGIFSSPGAAAEQWPSVTLMQVIRLPGRFISRQDGLMLAVWMASIFVLLGGYIFYTDEMTKQLFPERYFKGTMLLWLVLVYGLFWLTDDYGRFEQFYWKIMAFAGLPVSVFIAVWLLACGKKRRMVVIRYKYLRLWGLVLILVFMTGCGSVQLEDRNYVMALGLDAENGKIRASFSFPDLEALTGKGSNIHYPVTSISGDNMDDIKRQYERGSNRRLDYGQLQVIVFGRSIFENEPALETLLAYMKTRTSFARTILVCRAENTAEEIIRLDEQVNGSVGLYIREMFENNGQNAGYDQTALHDLMTAWKNKSETTELAVLCADDEKRPEICGVFRWPEG